jgi:hypothetical protein
MTDLQSPSDVPPALAPRSRMVRWLAPLFLIAGLGLVPWTVYLSLTLPSRHVQTGYYDVAWGGFDLALAAALFATGVGLVRRRFWVGGTAVAAGTMLVCDAWFDVLTSSGATGRLEAVVMAAAVELPTAVLCFAVARNVEDAIERTAAYAQAAGRLRRRTRRG